MNYQSLRQALVLVLCCFFSLAAQATEAPPLAKNAAPLAGQSYFIPPAPTLDAKGYVLLDVYTGKVLAEKDPNAHLEPASLTKLMTLYVISQALKSGQIHLEDDVRISARARSMDGSRMFVQEGSMVKVKDLVQGIIVASGNDACVAMAEHVAGTEETFVALMNEQAQKLGMKDSHFTDCTGMPDPNHYSSPLDIAILSRALMTHFPDYYPWYAQKWFTYNGIKQPNRNRLLWRNQYADGLKTGHTEGAGYCLAASAKKDTMRLVSVVMGAPTDNSRADSTQQLLTYGFRFFQTQELYKGGTAISHPRIWKGDAEKLPVGVDKDLVLLIPAGQYKNLQIVSVINKPLVAPVKKGQAVGTLNVSLGNNVLFNTPLVALKTVEQGSLWQRIRDAVTMKFAKVLDEEEDGTVAKSTSETATNA